MNCNQNCVQGRKCKCLPIDMRPSWRDYLQAVLVWLLIASAVSVCAAIISLGFL